MLYRIKIFVCVCSLAGVGVFAQPQAPVVWGEARWLGVGNTPIIGYPACLMGDSLALAGAVANQETPPRYCAGVISSFNNGSNFGSWHCLDTVFYGTVGGVNFDIFGSSGRVFALKDGRLERSVDAGLSWAINRPCPQHSRIVAGASAGQYTITVEYYHPSETVLIYRAAISNNGGDHWTVSIPVAPEIPSIMELTDVAVTQNHILLLGYQQETPCPMMAARGDRNGQNWLPAIILQGPPQLYANRSYIVGDSTSETAMVSQVVDYAPHYEADLWINRTTDGGQSWEAARNMSNGHPLTSSVAMPRPFGRGKLWGIVWEDVWNSDSTQWGVYWRFSANHGKDWYSAQPLGLNIYFMTYSCGQFIGNEVRIYWIQHYGDYGMMTGIMTPDTLPPDIFACLLPPDTIRAGDSVWFAAQTSDNDTLSEVRVVVLDSADHKTVVVLSNTISNQYQGGFIVPYDGLFRFRGEAEDFWENVGAYPDTGWLSFHTEGYPDAIDPSSPYPTTFSMSVFPNPFNSIAQIKFTLPVTQRVSLCLYNVLGREVAVLLDEIKTAGEHCVSFDGGVLPSGVYLCRMQAGTYINTRKIALVK